MRLYNTNKSCDNTALNVKYLNMLHKVKLKVNLLQGLKTFK